jgi:glycosyltransferase involved in cell wall biosynthesis
MNQHFRGYEFIIVDDINPDNIVKYLETLTIKNKKVRLIRNETNIGLTRSLIKAMKHVKGQYIARQDADDISTADRFTEQVKRMDQEKELVLVGSWYSVHNRYVRHESISIKKPPNNDIELRKLLFLTNPFCHASVMIRKSAYDKVAGYDSRYLTSQDLDLWFKLAKIGRMGVVEKILVKRIIHSGALSVSTLKSLIQIKNGIVIRFIHRRMIGQGTAIMSLVISAIYQMMTMVLPYNLSKSISGMAKRL